MKNWSNFRLSLLTLGIAAQCFGGHSSGVQQGATQYPSQPTPENILRGIKREEIVELNRAERYVEALAKCWAAISRFRRPAEFKYLEGLILFKQGKEADAVQKLDALWMPGGYQDNCSSEFIHYLQSRNGLFTRATIEDPREAILQRFNEYPGLSSCILPALTAREAECLWAISTGLSARHFESLHGIKGLGQEFWYRKALAIDPDNVIANYQIAVDTLGAGRYQEAEAHLLRALARSSEDFKTAIEASLQNVRRHLPDPLEFQN